MELTKQKTEVENLIYVNKERCQKLRKEIGEVNMADSGETELARHVSHIRYLAEWLADLNRLGMEL